MSITVPIITAECEGWATLLSPWNKGKIEVKSRKLQRRMKKRGRRNCRKKVTARGMRFIKVNGNCCWEVREHYHGGESKELRRAHSYYLPWSIRSVKLIECWIKKIICQCKYITVDLMIVHYYNMYVSYHNMLQINAAREGNIST